MFSAGAANFKNLRTPEAEVEQASSDGDKDLIQRSAIIKRSSTKEMSPPGRHHSSPVRFKDQSEQIE